MCRIFAAVLFFWVVAGDGADAAKSIKYASAEGWDIYVDPSMGNACYATTVFEGGAILRVSFDAREGAESLLNVLVGDGDWTSIEYGKIYPLTVRLGRKGPWNVDAVGFSFDAPKNQHYLKFTVNRDYTRQGLFDFMEQEFFAIEYKGEEILRLSLKGSYQAGLKMLECQGKAADAKVKHDRDPFRRSPSAKRDPFQ